MHFMDLIIMVSLAVALTAALVAREVSKNRRARSILIGDGYEVDLSPPWFVSQRAGAAHSSEDARPQGVWSSWYREGTLGAYVCTYASVTARATSRPIPISSARLEIVDDPDGRQDVLAAEDIPIRREGRSAGVSRLEIDASISVASPPPGKNATLVLLLNLDGKRVERRLCAVEHRFVAAGASIKEPELERV
jgi:hypothetical protein